MTELAADTPQVQIGPVQEDTQPVAADAVIWAGAQVCWDADGYLVPASQTSGLVMAGIALEAVNNTGGDDGDLDCRFAWGHIAQLKTAELVQANIGKNVTVVDDSSVGKAGTTNPDIYAGTLVGIVDATTVLVAIRVFANTAA